MTDKAMAALLLTDVFEVFVHISSFYALALDANKDCPEADQWNQQTNFVVNDMGASLKIWDGAEIEISEQLRTKLLNRKMTLIKRINAFMVNLTIWSCPKDWIRTLKHSEQAWLRFIQDIAQHLDQSQQELLTHTIDATTDRIKCLQMMLVEAANRIEVVNSTYAIPVDLTAEVA